MKLSIGFLVLGSLFNVYGPLPTVQEIDRSLSYISYVLYPLLCLCKAVSPRQVIRNQLRAFFVQRLMTIVYLFVHIYSYYNLFFINFITKLIHTVLLVTVDVSLTGHFVILWFKNKKIISSNYIGIL